MFIGNKKIKYSVKWDKTVFCKAVSEIYAGMWWQINLWIIKRKVPPYFFIFLYGCTTCCSAEGEPAGTSTRAQGELSSQLKLCNLLSETLALYHSDTPGMSKQSLLGRRQTSTTEGLQSWRSKRHNLIISLSFELTKKSALKDFSFQILAPVRIHLF